MAIRETQQSTKRLMFLRKSVGHLTFCGLFSFNKFVYFTALGFEYFSESETGVNKENCCINLINLGK